MAAPELAWDTEQARRELCDILNIDRDSDWGRICAAAREVSDAADVARGDTHQFSASDVKVIADTLAILDDRALSSPVLFAGTLTLVDEDGDPIPLPVTYENEAGGHYVALRPGVAGGAP
jgi:hypothetical protein